MQQGQEAWKSSRYMHSAYTFLKTLVFPPDEWFWDLELGFQCGAAKRGNRANWHFFLSRSSLSVFCVRFSSRSRAHFCFALTTREKLGRQLLVLSLVFMPFFSPFGNFGK